MQTFSLKKHRGVTKHRKMLGVLTSSSLFFCKNTTHPAKDQDRIKKTFSLSYFSYHLPISLVLTDNMFEQRNGTTQFQFSGLVSPNPITCGDGNQKLNVFQDRAILLDLAITVFPKSARPYRSLTLLLKKICIVTFTQSRRTFK
jgi:hypothetical protein